MPDEGGYLQNLTLYTSQAGIHRPALKRSADLDASWRQGLCSRVWFQHGFRIFWITADLAGNAPDGSAIQMETTGLDGQKQNLNYPQAPIKTGRVTT